MVAKKIIVEYAEKAVLRRPVESLDRPYGNIRIIDVIRGIYYGLFCWRDPIDCLVSFPFTVPYPSGQ
jgi:hypothetical protein